MRNYLTFLLFIVVCLSMEFMFEYPNVHKINVLEKQLEIKDNIYKCKSNENKRSKQLITEQLRSEKYENQILRDQLDKAKQENEKLKKDILSRKEVEQRQLIVNATAYQSKCLGCSGFTFTHHDVRNTIYAEGRRVIASDNSIIPLYSIVRVDARNESFEAIVLDRGGGIKGNEIDVLVKSENDAKQFGRQNVKITFIRKGKG